jgi:hypothetical protein
MGHLVFQDLFTFILCALINNRIKIAKTAIPFKPAFIDG